MKTLFIAPQVPWPLDAGSKIRTHHLLRCYAEVSDVTLVCFAESEAEAAGVRHLSPYCRRVDCFAVEAKPPMLPRRWGKFRALRQAFTIQPHVVRYFSSRDLSAHVASLTSTESFDFLHVERLFMAKNVGTLLRRSSRAMPALLVLDLDDFESEKMRRVAALEPWSSRRKYFHLLEFLKLRTYERLTLPCFGRVLVCSEKDRLCLASSGRIPEVDVFSNGADVADCTLPSGIRDDGYTLTFLGAMSYRPNEDAAIYFAKSILPLVREKCPEVRFVVAGNAPGPQLRALHNGQDVIVTGYIEDKNQLFASCTAFVVPLRIGGGTRLKILEAMAFGKPVVSTAIGCEGIDVTPDENILIADSPEEFAAACVSLLQNEGRRELLGKSGRALVLRDYQWQEIRRRYVDVLKQDLRQADRSKSGGYPSTPTVRS